ncbi:MAG: paraquat-inducible protein A [Cardiobacteriaceae bacterium]|nr:paraquat-inducible protein A [Cardiobacteriaceae bacterium]
MRGWRIAMALWIAAGMAAFVAGITLPMMTLTRLVWFDNTFTVLSGIGALLAEETFALGMLLMTFSVIFPAVKFLGMLAYVLVYPPLPRALVQFQYVLGKVAKFSMLDVFVVAVMLMVVKLGAIANVEIHGGIYWFSAAVLVSMSAGLAIEHDIGKRLYALGLQRKSLNVQK